MLSFYELIGHKHATSLQPSTWARSEAGLSRLPVTEKIAGSNPVGPATKVVHRLVNFFRASFFATFYYVLAKVFKPLIHYVPIDYIPPSSDVIGTFVFIVKVIGMFPNVEAKNRFGFTF